MLRFFFKFIFLLLCFQLTSFAAEINLNELVKKATSSNKKVFVFLHRTGCGYCDSMITFTLDDDLVIALIEKKFEMIHINVMHNNTVIYKDFKGSGREFAKHIGYNFYPSSIFLDQNVELVHAEVGYIDEKEFPLSLNYVISESYKKMDIVDYMQSQKP